MEWCTLIQQHIGRVSYPCVRGSIDLRRCDSFKAFSRSEDGMEGLAVLLGDAPFTVVVAGPLLLLAAVLGDDGLPDDNPAEIAASMPAKGSTSSA